MTLKPEELAKLFLEGNDEEALKRIQELMDDKNFSYLKLYEEIITPAMYYIGELWEKNQISVADEHLATAVCDFTLSQIDDRKNSLLSKSERTVILLGVEEEQHYLGMKMAASIFRHAGWKVKFLGANLSLDHALLYINRCKPEVIGLSAALSYRLPKLNEYIAAFKKTDYNPSIMIGGRMTRKHDLSAFTEDRVMVMEDLRALENWLYKGEVGDKNARI